MKTSNLLLIVLAALTIAASPVGAAAFAGDYALLVGVKNYGQRSGLNSLSFTENDVEDLAKLLIDNGYASANVTVMTQTRSLNEPGLSPTRDNILRELDLILEGRDASDNILVAFAGHGVKFKDGKESYFCPINVEVTGRKNLISYDSLYEKLRFCPARQKLILSDACRNDPLAASARSIPSVTRPEAQIPPGSTVALFACQAGQEAKEDNDLKHGVFFNFVLEGLRGAADNATSDPPGNGNQSIELLELAAFTQKRVQDHVRSKFRGKQIPDFRGNLNPLELNQYSLLKLTPQTITNSIGMKLRLIPAGEFQMGSGVSAAALAKQFGLKPSVFTDEYPQHQVRITKPFYLGQHEVTVGQFRRFVSDTDYKTEAELDGKGGYGYDMSTGKFEQAPEFTWRKLGFSQNDDYPVANVSWNDAVAFCAWLSQQEEVEYRLPTEAEWEYSCRAGTTWLYQHGDNPEGLVFVGNVADGTFAAELPETYLKLTGRINAKDGYAIVAPVGKFRANEFGLFDMHGNVWEWCSDWYASDYYKAAPTTDARGPLTGPFRVSRGGSWNVNAWLCRSTDRGGNDPDFRSAIQGFRVVRSSIK